MALFGGSRDGKLVNTFNKELIKNIVDTKVDVYKTVVPHSSENIYGESLKKVYLNATRIACHVEYEDPTFNIDEFGTDINQGMTFYFLKEILQNESNLFLEIGDIVNWNESYWELDTVIESNFWTDKNPDTNKGYVDTATTTNVIDSDFGLSVSIICGAHLTKRSNLAIERTNVGVSGKRRNLPSNI
tara:strand:+ start:121 stop:681 length:561 start_codon:yes stop_codon:yes gene_type:complete